IDGNRGDVVCPCRVRGGAPAREKQPPCHSTPVWRDVPLGGLVSLTYDGGVRFGRTGVASTSRWPWVTLPRRAGAGASSLRQGRRGPFSRRVEVSWPHRKP